MASKKTKKVKRAPKPAKKVTKPAKKVTKSVKKVTPSKKSKKATALPKSAYPAYPSVDPGEGASLAGSSLPPVDEGDYLSDDVSGFAMYDESGFD